MIQDLQAEIARLHAAKKTKSSPGRKQARSAYRALEKALPLAQEENDANLERAISKAMATIDTCLQGGGAVSTSSRVRRTAEDLDQIGQQVVDFVRSNPQSTVGAISDALNESSKELREPIALLLEQGSLRKEGQRRGTRYFVK